MLTAGGLIIAGLVAAVGLVAFHAADNDEPTAGGKLVTPANLTAAGTIPVGEPAAPVTVEIVLDYLCPACGRFEQANGGELDRLVRAGTAKVELRPISFLDRTSQGARYSTRAKATKAAFDSGVTGTPRVSIDGTVFPGDVYRAGPLTQAVEAAARSGT